MRDNLSWIEKLKHELLMSKMTHSFTFTRDEVKELLEAPKDELLKLQRMKYTVGVVLEGWNMPEGLRKVLEAAYFHDIHPPGD